MPAAQPVLRKAWLTRGISSPIDGVLGKMVTDTAEIFQSAERPWLDDQPMISCIPTNPIGYLCTWTMSADMGFNTYELQDVPGRNGIRIHPANVFDELEGCIALGLGVTLFQANSIRAGIPAVARHGVASSDAAIHKFESIYRDKNGEQVPFLLIVT